MGYPMFMKMVVVSPAFSDLQYTHSFLKTMEQAYYSTHFSLEILRRCNRITQESTKQLQDRIIQVKKVQPFVDAINFPDYINVPYRKEFTISNSESDTFNGKLKQLELEKVGDQMVIKIMGYGITLQFIRDVLNKFNQHVELDENDLFNSVVKVLDSEQFYTLFIEECGNRIDLTDQYIKDNIVAPLFNFFIPGLNLKIEF